MSIGPNFKYIANLQYKVKWRDICSVHDFLIAPFDRVFVYATLFCSRDCPDRHEELIKMGSNH